jgi:protein-S-isoprenylcysteine O-methyltransferase Ste14
MNLERISIAGLAMALVALVSLVFRESFLGEGLVAILVQVLAALLMLWARMTFGRRSFHAAADPTEGGLMTSGPYHYLRHPIYAAIMYFLWAGIASHLSLWNVSLGIIATIGLFIRILAEERLVSKRYPDYVEYASRTKRIIPFVL